jgi:hypothetical protein
VTDMRLASSASSGSIVARVRRSGQLQENSNIGATCLHLSCHTSSLPSLSFAIAATVCNEMSKLSANSDEHICGDNAAAARSKCPV